MLMKKSIKIEDKKITKILQDSRMCVVLIEQKNIYVLKVIKLFQMCVKNLKDRIINFVYDIY